MKAELTIGKSVITFVIVLFSIIVYCRFQCEGQGKKQTFECQKYHLLQAHLDRWDADNHRFKLIIDKSSSIKRRLLLIVRPYLLSLFTRGLERSLLHMLYYQES